MTRATPCKVVNQHLNHAPVHRGGGFVFPGVVIAPVDIPDRTRDGETFVTTAEAAQLMRVAISTVSRWKSKGYLKPVPGSPPRKPIYTYSAVLEAEYIARRKGIEASGSDRQVRRTYESEET